MNCKLFVFYVFCPIIFLSGISFSDDSKKSKSHTLREERKKDVLADCLACKTLVLSFVKGMVRTNKKNLGGGDTAWEEEHGFHYPTSQVRLADIEGDLCSDVERGQAQCYKLAQEWEELIEHWWTKVQLTGESDLFKWLCIEQTQKCCPDNHYGPKCTPCDGYPDNICSNNGKCKGAGTRKGNGECSCSEGYTGPKCDECSKLYFESYKDDKKLLCSKCHLSCRESCSSAGPKGCENCKSGWIHDPDQGCFDINECATLDPCKRNQFCVNNEGSYTCLSCDLSCDGCFGDGPDMCTKCANDHFLKDGFCTRGEVEGRATDFTRYLTYLGLCVATFIIFQKNTYIASLVGLSVAIYVSLSEYMLNKISIQNS